MFEIDATQNKREKLVDCLNDFSFISHSVGEAQEKELHEWAKCWSGFLINGYPLQPDIYKEPALVCTPSGENLDLLNPSLENTTIEDIAYTLSRLPRFGGRYKTSLEDDIYSVAQHSVYVSKDLQNRKKYSAVFWGLMHDAPEFLYGDIVTPLKKMLPEFGVMENKYAAGIRRKFSIPFDGLVEEDTKVSDHRLLYAEATELLEYPSIIHEGFPESKLDIRDVDPHFYIWKPSEARKNFIKHFETITGKQK